MPSRMDLGRAGIEPRLGARRNKRLAALVDRIPRRAQPSRPAPNRIFAPPMREELPYLTTAVPPLACAVKAYPEDFVVEERLEREPQGRGPFVWIEVEKRGLSTHQAARRLALALGVAPRSVGYAGLKDARAVARQSFSVEDVGPERALGLSLDGLRVLAAQRDEGRLRPGRGVANRFRIRLRDVAPGAAQAVRAVLGELEQRGLPNWFGEQ